MMTAPLYMTEKVGMMTWSRSQPATLLHGATRTLARQPAATCRCVCEQAAAKSSEAHWPPRLRAFPPSAAQFLISYVTKGAEINKLKK